MLRSLEHALLSPFDFVNWTWIALLCFLCFVLAFFPFVFLFCFLLSVQSGAASMMIHSTHAQPVEAGQPSQLAHMRGSTLVTCWSP
jgi:hypothetical protein